MFVALSDDISHTVFYVIFQNDLCGIAQCGLNCGELNQNIGTVTIVLHHPANGF